MGCCGSWGPPGCRWAAFAWCGTVQQVFLALQLCTHRQRCSLVPERFRVVRTGVGRLAPLLFGQQEQACNGKERFCSRWCERFCARKRAVLLHCAAALPVLPCVRLSLCVEHVLVRLLIHPPGGGLGSAAGMPAALLLRPRLCFVPVECCWWICIRVNVSARSLLWSRVARWGSGYTTTTSPGNKHTPRCTLSLLMTLAVVAGTLRSRVAGL